MLFQVMLEGYGLQLKIENSTPINAGFVKNEFVLANSESEACKHAIELVNAQLQQQANSGGLVLMEVNIVIESVARSLKFWKLVQPEGFVYFSREKTMCERSPLH